MPSTDAPKVRRLFFALWPDDATRAMFAHATHKAARASGGRPVPAANLHSTLVFLGNVPEDRLPAVNGVAAALKHAPLHLSFDRLEHWPKPAVLCVGCSGVPVAVLELASSLWKLLVKQGFTPDPKPYRPHMTIARKVVKPHALGAIHPIEWPINEIALVESVTAPEGPQYTVLERWALRQ